MRAACARRRPGVVMPCGSRPRRRPPGRPRPGPPHGCPSLRAVKVRFNSRPSLRRLLSRRRIEAPFHPLPPKEHLRLPAGLPWQPRAGRYVGPAGLRRPSALPDFRPVEVCRTHVLTCGFTAETRRRCGTLTSAGDRWRTPFGELTTPHESSESLTKESSQSLTLGDTNG